MRQIRDFLRVTASQNVLKLISKSQTFVTFGANMTQCGSNYNIPACRLLLPPGAIAITFQVEKKTKLKKYIKKDETNK